MPGAVGHTETDCKEPVRQAEKAKEGEKEIKRPWGPIRRSSEGL